MEPGRELDTLVAEKVMGLVEKDWPKPCYKYHSMDGEFWCYSCAKGISDVEREPPRYSTDIADAWEVVEKMVALGYSPDIVNHSRDEWRCMVDKYEEEAEVQDWQDWPVITIRRTAPHAICLAALKAVGALP